MIAEIRGHRIYYELHEPQIGGQGARDKGRDSDSSPLPLGEGWGRNSSLTPNPSPIGRGEKPFPLSLVLLHDGLGSVRAWRAQIPVLTAAGFRVLAYDRFGYGRSDDRPSLHPPYFEDDQSDFLALADLLGLERFYLVGHSDGGTLALYLAARYPERVLGLVVVAAHIYIEPSMPPALAALRDRFEADEGFRLSLRRQHGEKYRSLFYHWIDSWSQPQNLAWDMRPQLARVKCPVLVVQGELDEHATPQHARDLSAALPSAELWLVPGAAHMLPQETPQFFNPRLVEFIEQQSSLTPAPLPKGEGKVLPPSPFGGRAGDEGLPLSPNPLSHDSSNSRRLADSSSSSGDPHV